MIVLFDMIMLLPSDKIPPAGETDSFVKILPSIIFPVILVLLLEFHIPPAFLAVFSDIVLFFITTPFPSLNIPAP